VLLEPCLVYHLALLASLSGGMVMPIIAAAAGAAVFLLG